MKELDKLKKKHSLKKFSAHSTFNQGAQLMTRDQKPAPSATVNLKEDRDFRGIKDGVKDPGPGLTIKTGGSKQIKAIDPSHSELDQIKSKINKTKDISDRLKDGDDSALEEGADLLRDPSGARERKSSPSSLDKVNAPNAKTLDLSQDKDEVSLALSAIKKKKVK